MAVYLDDARIPAQVGRIRGVWSHLTADTDAELHELAGQLGLRRSWFQVSATRPEANHYDVVEAKRADALRLGAVAETTEAGAIRRRAAMQRRRDSEGGGK
jgi:hypothetical protein